MRETDFDLQENRNRFRTLFLAGAAVVLILTLIAAVICIRSGIKTGKYNSLITLGNAYYANGQYQEAMQEYQSALELNEKEETAYLNLSAVYAALEDYKQAGIVLSTGIEKIGSAALREKLQQIETLSNTKFADAAKQMLSSEEIEKVSAEVTIENETFDKIAAYTYTEYYRDFGNAVSVSEEGDGIVLYYDALDFYASYYDLDHEKVLDPSGKMPIATAKPCSVQFAHLSVLFGSEQEIYAVSRAKLEEFFGESAEFYQSEENGNNYISVEYKGCKLTVVTDENGNIISETAWNKVEPLNRSREEAAKDNGRISGYVQNAVSGQGMHATLRLREKGVRAGNAIMELQTAADGSYSYLQAEGSYTVEVSASGYVTEYVNVDIIAGQVKTGMNIVLSPTVGEGEIRIVLTWGAYPTDLDSHTEGTSSTGTNFHIYYREKVWTGIGTLDVDDTNGNGPETTTISDAGADFTFRVEDFTQSGDMSASGAMVKVYLPGGEPPMTYTVPDGNGNVWTVFRYENGKVVPVNVRE